MISGAHAVLHRADPDADRAFLRDVLGLPHIDSGGGWLIFGLPPSEVAIHPAEKSGAQELYFLVDDVKAFVASMKQRKIACGPVQKLSWGQLTELTLPGGGTVGVYEPRHGRPPLPRRRAAPVRSIGVGRKAVKAPTKVAKPRSR